LGRLVAVRAPRELDDIFRRAGGTWEPGSRRWLIERRRIGPVIRALRSTTDPLSGERVSRITLFDGAVSTAFDGLPASASRLL